jgi:peptide deformylase
MSVAKIRIYPDPILQTRAAEIEKIDERVVRLAGVMAETMYSAPGVGLAAPQIGVSERIICIDVRSPEEEKELITLINPVIIEAEGRYVGEEGCLSVPEIRENVSRALRVVVRGLDLSEQQREIETVGLLARALQHEIDHLDGILFIDRISRLKRRIIQRKLRKRLQEAAAAQADESRLF